MQQCCTPINTSVLCREWAILCLGLIGTTWLISHVVPVMRVRVVIGLAERKSIGSGVCVWAVPWCVLHVVRACHTDNPSPPRPVFQFWLSQPELCIQDKSGQGVALGLFLPIHVTCCQAPSPPCLVVALTTRHSHVHRWAPPGSGQYPSSQPTTPMVGKLST